MTHVMHLRDTHTYPSVFQPCGQAQVFFCGAKDLKPTYETEAGVGARPGNLKLGIGLKAIAFSLRAKARVELSEVRHRAS